MTGSCLCRKVRFEIRGELGSIVYCHCESCRKAQGTAFAANAPVAEEDFVVTSGAELIAKYESSPGKYRCFCRNCGSPVWSRGESLPGTVRIRLGTLDGDPRSRPVLHVWIAEKAPWFEITDRLPKFRTGDPESLIAPPDERASDVPAATFERHAGGMREPEASAPALEVVALSAEDAQRDEDALADVLCDAVDSGASVSFMAPFTHEDGLLYWRSLGAALREGDIVLLGAFLNGKLVGTVQLHLRTPPNQPHRAEVAKLLVHQTARRRGIGRMLMAHAEEVARRRGRSLLTFDTLAGSAAERLYLRMGYVRAGVIPGYAKLPTGQLGDTSIFYKAVT